MSIDYSQVKIIGSIHQQQKPIHTQPSIKSNGTTNKSNKNNDDRVNLVKDLVNELKSYQINEDTGKSTKHRMYTKKQRLEMIKQFIIDTYINEEKHLKV
jgi:hypothetical protein